MSFFSRKPNPPVHPSAGRLIGAGMPPLPAKGANGPAGPPQGAAQQSPQVAADPNTQKAQSNNRFRSFAERYIVERCRDWKEGEIDERAWGAILEAKSIYNKVREVGRTLGDDT